MLCFYTTTRTRESFPIIPNSLRQKSFVGFLGKMKQKENQQNQHYKKEKQ